MKGPNKYDLKPKPKKKVKRPNKQILKWNEMKWINPVKDFQSFNYVTASFPGQIYLSHT